MALKKIDHSLQVCTRYPPNLPRFIIWTAFTVWQNPFHILFDLQIVLLLNQVLGLVFQRVMTLNLHSYRDSEPLNAFCGIALSDF